jgi:isopenicillin N synthase-like dioxygenase
LGATGASQDSGLEMTVNLMTTESKVIVKDGFVPVIDLSTAKHISGRTAIAQAIRRACETSGFFTIVGHGVDQELIERVYRVSKTFFELPREEREKVAIRPGTQGLNLYGGSVTRSIGREAPPDLTEVFRSTVTGDLPTEKRAKLGTMDDPWAQINLWPQSPAEFKPTFLEYMRVMQRLAKDLMSLFALALDLEEHYFDQKIDHGISSLVANYYPPQLQPPLPGQLRKGAHTDWGILTILYQDDLGGLQVEQEGSGWHDIAFVPGSYVINLGDLMAFWTGGHWVSTMHRVTNPVTNRDKGRVSIPFFLYSNYDLKIEPLPQFSLGGKSERFKGSTTAGDWYRARLKATLS